MIVILDLSCPRGKSCLSSPFLCRAVQLKHSQDRANGHSGRITFGREWDKTVKMTLLLVIIASWVVWVGMWLLATLACFLTRILPRASHSLLKLKPLWQCPDKCCFNGSNPSMPVAPDHFWSLFCLIIPSAGCHVIQWRCIDFLLVENAIHIYISLNFFWGSIFKLHPQLCI